jgi:hypothetical protein
MLDDFNPNMPEPVEKCCPVCGYDPDEGKITDDLYQALVGILMVIAHARLIPESVSCMRQARIALAAAYGHHGHDQE